jgi:hypothetical protein
MPFKAFNPSFHPIQFPTTTPCPFLYLHVDLKRLFEDWMIVTVGHRMAVALCNNCPNVQVWRGYLPKSLQIVSCKVFHAASSSSSSSGCMHHS